MREAYTVTRDTGASPIGYTCSSMALLGNETRQCILDVILLIACDTEAVVQRVPQT
jgi:hypothetical protein